jgi:predicted GNAT family acetyltransferase
VKILLDECIDWRLARDILGHEVKTARQMGWATVKNGELLKLTGQFGFDVFVTVDCNLSFQQNVPVCPFAVIVLRARSNRLATLKLLLPQFLEALEVAKPGSVVTVSVA